MTLAQLRHLVALAESGSFSRSAAALFLTQPALSRSIRALESELGQPLLDRIGRRSELTPFGREVLARARALVAGADDLRDSGRQMAQGEAGSLRIGLGSRARRHADDAAAAAHGHAAPAAAPGHFARPHRAAGAEPARAHARRAGGRRPFAGARTCMPATHARCAAVPVPRGHPLARKRGGVTFEQVSAYPIASSPLSDEVARTLVERYGPQAHPQACVTLRCEEVPSLVELTRHSDTVLLAIRASGPDLHELALKPALAATARFCLVTLAGRTEAPALAIVRELMDELMRD